jgi:putative colanic acid biosynthesis UDP-glucose lipid carrier transferase
MERITSPGRLISILIQEGFSNRYSQLFRPASLIEQDRELMRYTPQHNLHHRYQQRANVVVNNAFTFNGLLIEGENENIFYPKNYWFRSTKRAFDILFSLAVIIFVFSWLFPIIYILIKLETEGPVFFVQKRSCRGDNVFNCYKFRSMYVNKECDTSQTARDDARITKVGAFLRQTSLDELPQFFNVLMGNMSVIGPRPHMLCQTKKYAELIDSFMIRHFVKPGITGWAQVNGLRGQTTTVDEMMRRVEADVWYLKHWSFLLDMKIILLTISKTLKGDKSAY